MKNNRIISLIGLCLTLSLNSFSQENDTSPRNIENRKNNIDLTIGGTGVITSLNYNRIIKIKPKYFINYSIGFGIIPYSGGITLPHQLTSNFGAKNSFLELGIGGFYWTDKGYGESYALERLHSYQLCPIIGWRKHFKSNLLLRTYACPFFSLVGEQLLGGNSFSPYLGISLGYSF